MRTKTKPSKLTYSQASLAMSMERERVIKDAQSSMMKSQCFTDAMIYGLPFEFGEGKPATRTLGWARPGDGIPDGCEPVARIPVSSLSQLQACRMLASKMENFPAFNPSVIA